MRVKLGFDASSIHADFINVLGDRSPSYPTVARWVTRFKVMREELEYDERIGRPITMTTQANSELVRAVILEANSFLTYDDIQAETSLCHGTINYIIQKPVLAAW